MPVWQKAMELATEIFTLTIDFPKSEDYGLTSQIRRSATSVHANLAEGFGRNTNKDKADFFDFLSPKRNTWFCFNKT